MAVKNVNKIMIGLNKNNNKTMKQHFTHTHTYKHDMKTKYKDLKMSKYEINWKKMCHN